MVTAVAPVTFHVSVEGWPLVMLVGLAVKLILISVGTGFAVVTLVVAIPCAP